MIVTVLHNRDSYEYSIEFPETTTISDLKEFVATVLHCYQNNIRLIYSGLEQNNDTYLSEYNRNNLTLYTVIVPIVCQIHQSAGEPTDHEIQSTGRETT